MCTPIDFQKSSYQNWLQRHLCISLKFLFMDIQRRLECFSHSLTTLNNLFITLYYRHFLTSYALLGNVECPKNLIYNVSIKWYIIFAFTMFWWILNVNKSWFIQINDEYAEINNKHLPAIEHSIRLIDFIYFIHLNRNVRLLFEYYSYN